MGLTVSPHVVCSGTVRDGLVQQLGEVGVGEV